MKKLFLFLCVAVLALSAGFAQRTTKTQNFVLTVTVSPSNAKIFVDGMQIKGNSISVTSGAHTVQASAPGYKDKSVSVAVSADMNMRVDLEPDTAVLVIKPRENPGKGPSKGNGFGLMELWIDGMQVKMNRDAFEVEAGRHTLRFVSGDLAGETEIFVEPGQQYLIEPELSIRLTSKGPK